MTAANPDYASLTLDALNAAVGLDPLNVALHRLLSAKQQEQGDELAAIAHMIAVKALETWHNEPNSAAAWDIYLVATGYFMKGDYVTAEKWYRLVLMLNERIAEVHQNMVVIHEHFDRDEQAEACRTQAYQLQRIFVEPVINPIRRVLILCVGRSKGNIPYEALLAQSVQRIKYIIDYATDAEDAQLPRYDLVLNAIGEPDVAAPLMPRLKQFLKVCDRPVMNHPVSVMRTQRHLLPELMAGIANVQVADCIRIDAGHVSDSELSQILNSKQISFPVLIRPTGTHGGTGLVKCDDIEALTAQRQAIVGACYVCRYIDFVSVDGYYRKYRMIYVDRRPYPYHLGISRQWMVHYYTAEMEEHPWKIAEEQLYLQEPSRVMGEKAMNALMQIGQRLNLEYAGIDFTMMQDGTLLIFEANATMLVHKVNQEGVLAHKNGYVQAIANAFETMQKGLELII